MGNGWCTKVEEAGSKTEKPICQGLVLANKIKGSLNLGWEDVVGKGTLGLIGWGVGIKRVQWLREGVTGVLLGLEIEKTYTSTILIYSLVVSISWSMSV